MLNNLTTERFEDAAQPFLDSLPEGSVAQCIRFTPQVGTVDTAAGQVVVLVLADIEEDLLRVQQIIERGLASYRHEVGLTASLDRQRNIVSAPDLAPAAPTS